MMIIKYVNKNGKEDWLTKTLTKYTCLYFCQKVRTLKLRKEDKQYAFEQLMADYFFESTKGTYDYRAGKI